MLKDAELKILSAFFPEGEERTTKEIEGRSGYSHERAYSTLNLMEKRGILSKKKVGKALVYSINKFGDATYLAFAHYSINKKNNFIGRHPSVWRALEEFIASSKPGMAVLFGSYAKNEEKKGSDVDIICVQGNSNAEKIALSLRHKHNLRITPVVMRKGDFKNIARDNPDLWAEITRLGVVLTGQEMFYNLIYNGADGEGR